MLDAEKTAIADENKGICEGFGFKAGTEGMANCLMTQTNKRDAADAAALGARKEAEAAQRRAAGESIDSYKTKPITTTNCTTRYDGSMSCTTR